LFILAIEKNIFWNAMEMVRVNHRPYLFSIAKIGSSRICLQKHSKLELNYLKVCLDIANLNHHLCDSNIESSCYASTRLQFLWYKTIKFSLQSILFLGWSSMASMDGLANFDLFKELQANDYHSPT
jgi:hypothetical protein